MMDKRWSAKRLEPARGPLFEPARAAKRLESARQETRAGSPRDLNRHPRARRARARSARVWLESARLVHHTSGGWNGVEKCNEWNGKEWNDGTSTDGWEFCVYRLVVSP